MTRIMIARAHTSIPSSNPLLLGQAEGGSETPNFVGARLYIANSTNTVEPLLVNGETV